MGASLTTLGGPGFGKSKIQLYLALAHIRECIFESFLYHFGPLGRQDWHLGAHFGPIGATFSVNFGTFGLMVETLLAKSASETVNSTLLTLCGLFWSFLGLLGPTLIVS